MQPLSFLLLFVTPLCIIDIHKNRIKTQLTTKQNKNKTKNQKQDKSKQNKETTGSSMVFLLDMFKKRFEYLPYL